MESQTLRQREENGKHTNLPQKSSNPSFPLPPPGLKIRECEVENKQGNSKKKQQIYPKEQRILGRGNRFRPASIIELTAIQTENDERQQRCANSTREHPVPNANLSRRVEWLSSSP
jgi:hypothetical protein